MIKINNTPTTMAILLLASVAVVIGGLAVVPTTMQSAFADKFTTTGGCGTGGGSGTFCLGEDSGFTAGGCGGGGADENLHTSC